MQLSSYDIVGYLLYKLHWLLFVSVHANTTSYIHACTNEIYSLANLQDLIPTLPAITIGNTNQPKQGINLVGLLQHVFHLCIHGCNQLPSWNHVCMDTHRQCQCSLQSEQSAILKLDSQLGNLFPYFLLRFLLPFKFVQQDLTYLQ